MVLQVQKKKHQVGEGIVGGPYFIAVSACLGQGVCWNPEVGKLKFAKQSLGSEY
jgi:hypothetical protein